jgi:hypothetical protein
MARYDQMSKTRKDRVRREQDRRFTDGGYKKQENLFEHRKEKRIVNDFRSNNIESLLEVSNYLKYK